MNIIIKKFVFGCSLVISFPYQLIAEELTVSQIRERLDETRTVSYDVVNMNDIQIKCNLSITKKRVDWAFYTLTSKVGKFRLKSTTYIAANNKNYYTLDSKVYESKDPQKVSDVYVTPWLKFASHLVGDSSKVFEPIELEGKNYYKIISKVSEKQFDAFLNSANAKNANEIFMYKNVIDSGFIQKHGKLGDQGPSDLSVIMKKAKVYPLTVGLVYNYEDNYISSFLAVANTGEVVGNFNVSAQFTKKQEAPIIPNKVDKILTGKEFREIRAKLKKPLK